MKIGLHKQSPSVKVLIAHCCFAESACCFQKYDRNAECRCLYNGLPEISQSTCFAGDLLILLMRVLILSLQSHGYVVLLRDAGFDISGGFSWGSNSISNRSSLPLVWCHHSSCLDYPKCYQQNSVV